MSVLRDVVSWIERAEEGELSMKTICLREPRTADAGARVVGLNGESCLPPDALQGGYKYFLEAPLAREVLGVLKDRSRPWSSEEACNLLIHYAEHDAYPDWAFE